MLEAIISTLLGGLAGFVTSLYFWRKSQRKDRPRLYIRVSTVSQSLGEADFKIVNEGETHAISITLDESSSLETPADLAPKGEFDFETIGPDETKEYVLSYYDVWGTRYTATWYLAGPQKFEVEGGFLFDYAHAEKGYEHHGGLVSRLRALF